MKHNIDTLNKALQTYGIENQLDMLVEECSELIQAVCKYKRKIKLNNSTVREQSNLLEEMADVHIMMKQIEISFFSEHYLQDQINIKETRLANNLNKQ